MLIWWRKTKVSPAFFHSGSGKKRLLHHGTIQSEHDTPGLVCGFNPVYSRQKNLPWKQWHMQKPPLPPHHTPPPDFAVLHRIAPQQGSEGIWAGGCRLFFCFFFKWKRLWGPLANLFNQKISPGRKCKYCWGSPPHLRRSFPLGASICLGALCSGRRDWLKHPKWCIDSTSYTHTHTPSLTAPSTLETDLNATHTLTHTHIH